MDKNFIDILCCPKRRCRGDLEEILESRKTFLKCLNCRQKYEVVEGIPVLFPNVKYSPDINKRHWDKPEHAKSYAKKYDSYLKKQGSSWGLYTHISEVEAIRRLTESIDLTGKTIIDGGCGQGRLLEEYKEAGKKIGIDTSLPLLKAAKERNPSLWLVCGQLEDMPLKDAVADFSLSIRVFQHLLAPEEAFREMARTTKPSGYISLEVYNKLNLKEVYKRFRMMPLINRIKPWGLSYDRYYSWREIERWCEDNFVKTITYTGAGWGFYFYIFELFKFRLWVPEFLQKLIYDLFLAIERKVASLPIFRITMEKVSFIGSIQAPLKAPSILQRLAGKLERRRKLKKFKNFEKLFRERNYALAGSDIRHLRLSIDWLKKAQEATADSGISRGFSLIERGKANRFGWQPSYPETSGYIIPTLIEASEILCEPELKERARKIADWEINITNLEGGVSGGNIGKFSEPVVFDTGQVMRGLLAVYKETGQEKYLKQAEKSANWIVKNWKEEKVFDCYAFAPVAELGKLTKNDKFKKTAERCGQFAQKMQNKNGWFAECDFEKQRADPLLHTLGYAIDGLWDIGEILDRKDFKDSAKLALLGALSQMDERGYIAGRLNKEWKGTVAWACLTGIAQTGVTAMKIYKAEGNNFYRAKAYLAKEFLKTCQNLCEEKYGGLGALWGSFPISGEYNSWQALNWPVKYFSDLLMIFIKNSDDKD